MSYLSSIGISHKVGLTPKKSNNNSTTFNATPVAFTMSNGGYHMVLTSPQQMVLTSPQQMVLTSPQKNYCKAPGCTSCKAPGQTHYCRICYSTDSNHRSRYCPLKNRIYCRAVGCTSCTRPEQKHYCSSCGDDDSNHLTQNCKRVNNIIYYNNDDHNHLKSNSVKEIPPKKTPVIINGILMYV